MSNGTAPPVRAIRKVIFWLHLSTGVIAGLMILTMAVTGLMIGFEPQIVDFAEHDLRVIPAPGPDASRLSVNVLVDKAREAIPDAQPTALTVRSGPTASMSVNFGREAGSVFLNPYTGEVLGKGSRTHAVLHTIEDIHRYLGSRDIGKPITGAFNAAFLVMVISGFYLWWPRQWTGSALRAVTRFTPGLQGKARNWNRHNVIGFWCAPLLLVTTLTGLVMSYGWANGLLFRLTGNEPPPPQQPAPRAGQGGEGRTPQVQLPDLEPFWARAEQQVPGWLIINLRFPQRPGAPFTANIQESDGTPPNPRSQLTLDPVTAEVKKWEPASGQNMGRKLRSWVAPLHTGQAWGVPGQILACVGALGATMLVWTGLSMAWRRFSQRNRQSVPIPTASATGTAGEVITEVLVERHETRRVGRN